MRTRIAERLAGWYCRKHRRDATVRITSEVYRLVPTGRAYSHRLMVAEFDCRAGSAAVKRTLDVAVPGYHPHVDPSARPSRSLMVTGQPRERLVVALKPVKPYLRGAPLDRTKRAAGRPSDIEAIAELEALREERG